MKKMKRKNKKGLVAAICLLGAFLLWTGLVCLIDVQAIGPRGSRVGLATLNGGVHGLTGENMSLYILTDWLGLVPIGVALGFAILGLFQWIKRKRLSAVDRSILVLGVFYAVVIAVFLFFEVVVVNYRPVLIEGILEASYPSSTTLLVTCVMPTAMMQFSSRIKSVRWRRAVSFAITAFVVFMVVGRLLSGVHWVTDIIGGALLSAGLVTGYWYFSSCGEEYPNGGFSRSGNSF